MSRSTGRTPGLVSARPASVLAAVVPADARLMVCLVMAASALVDLPRRMHVGPLTGLAVATGMVVLFASVIWLNSLRVVPGVRDVIWPFVLFLVWGVLGFDRAPISAEGVQNLLVMLCFVVLLLVVGDRRYSSPGLDQYVGLTLMRATAFAAVLYAVSLGLGGLGSEEILSAPGFSLFAMAGLGWLLSRWRYGDRRSLWLAVGLTALIVLSLSRLATVTALLLFPAAWFQPRTARAWIRAVALLVALGAMAYIGVTRVHVLHEAFFGGASQRIRVAGLELPGTGRAQFWPATWKSFLESPWIGQGPGSASRLMAAEFPGIEHPHNDYLRIMHDYGVVGLALWLFGFLKLLVATWRGRERNDRRERGGGQPHLAAFLATLGLGIGMLGTNPWAYVFVMAPLGVICGVSLGGAYPRSGREEAPQPVHSAA
jgi:O-Antigen ligase